MYHFITNKRFFSLSYCLGEPFHICRLTDRNGGYAGHAAAFFVDLTNKRGKKVISHIHCKVESLIKFQFKNVISKCILYYQIGISTTLHCRSITKALQRSCDFSEGPIFKACWDKGFDLN